jgi:hypothetical protein
MEIKRFTRLRTFTYDEQQAVLAKFPSAFFMVREADIVDFYLPIERDDEARRFLVECNNKTIIKNFEKKG